MNNKFYSRPGNLRAIGDGSMLSEYRDGDTLIWEEDWWDKDRPSPLAVLPGQLTATELRLWSDGWKAGYTAGRKSGYSDGFNSFRAGFRALVGAASAADLETLLQVVKSVQDET